MIVFLSHIGSYVPADAATVGLTDRFFPFVYTQILKKCTSGNLFTDLIITPAENCDRIFCAMGTKFMTAEQSTFMIDLHQVGMMLRYMIFFV